MCAYETAKDDQFGLFDEYDRCTAWFNSNDSLEENLDRLAEREHNISSDTYEYCEDRISSWYEEI